MKDLIVSIISAAIEKAHTAGKLKSSSSSGTVGTEAPKDPSHGDIASNVALTLARAEGKAPRAIAEIIREHIELPDAVKEVSVAGPGFLNFRMAPLYWHNELRRAYGQSAVALASEPGAVFRARPHHHGGINLRHELRAPAIAC